MKGKFVLGTGANGALGTYVSQAFLDASATPIAHRGSYRSRTSTTDFTGLPAEISPHAESKPSLSEHDWQ